MKKTLLAAVLFFVSSLSAGATTIVSDPAFDSTGRDFTQITGSYDTQNVILPQALDQAHYQETAWDFPFI